MHQLGGIESVKVRHLCCRDTCYDLSSANETRRPDSWQHVRLHTELEISSKAGAIN